MPVVNRRTHQAKEGDLYIGRPSRWGNPFRIGRDGDREQVVQSYRRLLYLNVLNGTITLEELASLRNRNLVCYCAPALCHGHVLEAAANWAYGKLEERQKEKEPS